MRVILIVGAIALAGLLPACGGGGDAPKNLLLISVDTLRPDRMGCYGYSLDTSPVMDSLAAEGVLFEDVSSVSPWTLPSHATMLTGLLPSRHGVKDHVNKLADDRATLAAVLAEEGVEVQAPETLHAPDPRALGIADPDGMDPSQQLFRGGARAEEGLDGGDEGEQRGAVDPIHHVGGDAVALEVEAGGVGGVDHAEAAHMAPGVLGLDGEEHRVRIGELVEGRLGHGNLGGF